MKLVKLIIFIGMVFLADTAIAQFTVSDSSGDKKQWTKKSGPYYGNAQNEDFHDAIHGAPTLSPEEKDTVLSLIPEKAYDRWYGRFALNSISWQVSSIESKSTGTLTGLAVSMPKVKKSKTGFELAFGYAWKQYRAELEYVYVPKLDYNATPVLTGSAASLTSSIQSHGLFLNAYYDFWQAYIFKPYIQGGVGAGIHKTSGTLTGGGVSGTDSKQTIGLAWNIGIGARYRPFSRWFIDFGWRYGSLGTVKWAPNSGSASVLNLEGQYYMNGFKLGFTYLF